MIIQVDYYDYIHLILSVPKFIKNHFVFLYYPLLHEDFMLTVIIKWMTDCVVVVVSSSVCPFLSKNKWVIVVRN
jgi:hypothetical protein